MKWKIKGKGTPPTVIPNGGSGQSFNSPAGQYGGKANGRLGAYPHKGTVPGQPDNPDTGQGGVKKRAHFPRPRTSSNSGKSLKT